MSRTYTTTGINLKSMPLGEHDRLLTILTRECGLIRAVAPGARKHKSRLAGRSALFVVNELFLARGKSLDRITQAETVASYPGLSGNLGILTASQYLAELVLAQALSEQPQTELFELVNEHLHRLESLSRQATATEVLAHLTHGIFHLLAWGGIAPQVHACCLTQRPIVPDITRPDWTVAFAIDAGGVVSAGADLESKPKPRKFQGEKANRVREAPTVYRTTPRSLVPKFHLNSTELTLLQRMTQRSLCALPDAIAHSPTVEAAWVKLERLLRQYAEYHLGRSIRSATLMDSYIRSHSPLADRRPS
ncbi:MAG: DNA repair protein RecO [Cyanobacteriota bacterium]|nr:DNA repair protein RecO [Cyanobacteriota bacterium]